VLITGRLNAMLHDNDGQTFGETGQDPLRRQNFVAYLITADPARDSPRLSRQRAIISSSSPRISLSFGEHQIKSGARQTTVAADQQ
jgi:cytochrome oxidase Cu insertion factor (SCO1/SenC/PrrC family)